MNRVIKDYTILLDQEGKEQVKQALIQLSKAETLMAHNQQLIPLDFLLDFGKLTSAFFNFYTVNVSNDNGISYISYYERVEYLEETIETLKYRKQDELFKIIKFCEMALKNLKEPIKGLSINQLF